MQIRLLMKSKFHEDLLFEVSGGQQCHEKGGWVKMGLRGRGRGGVGRVEQEGGEKIYLILFQSSVLNGMIV